MSFQAGEVATAARLNYLQTQVYYAIGSGTVAASQTNADVTDATVTFTTSTANARYAAFCVWDFDNPGAPGGDGTARLSIDAVNQSPLATWGSSSGGRGTVSQNYSGTLSSTGSHTFKLVATTNTNMQVLGVNCSIMVMIMEVA